MTDAPTAPRPARDLAALAGLLALCLAVGGLGGMVTATSVDTWYPTLSKPGFTPPDWVFAPVWTALYLLMAVAAWRVWRCRDAPDRSRALAVFGVQLALNLGWSVLFFGLQMVGAAAVEVIVLLAAIVACALLFRRIDGTAAVLLAPYALWVAYAAALTISIWTLNPA